MENKLLRPFLQFCWWITLLFVSTAREDERRREGGVEGGMDRFLFLFFFVCEKGGREGRREGEREKTFLCMVEEEKGEVKKTIVQVISPWKERSASCVSVRLCFLTKHHSFRPVVFFFLLSPLSLF